MASAGTGVLSKAPLEGKELKEAPESEVFSSPKEEKVGLKPRTK